MASPIAALSPPLDALDADLRGAGRALEAELHDTGRAVSLAGLEPGSRAIVSAVDSSCAVGRRLLDLGFAPGTPVRVVRRAPLRDPIEYEVRGSRFCLRRVDAARVQVRSE